MIYYLMIVRKGRRTVNELWDIIREFVEEIHKVDGHYKQFNEYKNEDMSINLIQYKQDTELGNIKCEQKEEYICYNEGHSVKPQFKKSIGFNKHLATNHKCPLCNFVAMLDSQMSIHFETHSNMNFTNCRICYLQVFNLEQHISK